jgi:L-alanine-DL-glutamate epimerase-like enolase superfamily enzyme
VFYDLEGSAAVRRQVDVPIALDQAVFTDYDVARVGQQQAGDVIVIGFHETGGLLSLKKAAAVAAAFGLSVNRHAALGESGVSTMAALQVLSTIPNLTDGNQIMDDLFSENTIVDGLVDLTNGRTKVPDRPGLGVEIDWDDVAKFEHLFDRVGQYPM